MWHVLEHAAIETLKLLPWLLIIYIVIELLENKTDLSSKNKLGGKLGPLVGSATGLIPQCGFSVMAAKLFEQKYITLGTLLAIFFSTSDEAFIVLLSSGADGAVWFLPLVLVKIAVGVALGYAVDGILKLVKKGEQTVQVSVLEEKKPLTVHEIFIQNVLAEDEEDVECTSCGRTHDDKKPFRTYFLSPLLHSLKVAAFILAVNILLGTIIHFIGEDTFQTFMQKNLYLQPIITSAIGLIPNCASSVVITQTFLGGGISFGSLAAGLCANAGLGFVVLLKNTKKWKRNLILIAISYLTSVAIGFLINLVYPIFV
ncbi:MAG: arsenic efflux protein [Clostridia bacterium]|nr:arsenic efflux protein [Clostridia bacterium]